MQGKWFITESLVSKVFILVLGIELRASWIYMRPLTSNPLWGGAFEESSSVYQRNLGRGLIQTTFWEDLAHITLTLQGMLLLRLAISCTDFQWWNKHLCLLCIQGGSWGRECLPHVLILSSKESARKVRLQHKWFYAKCTETWAQKKKTMTRHSNF